MAALHVRIQLEQVGHRTILMKSDTKTEKDAGLPVLVRLKIGRHEYDITEKDRFVYNGACVQLLTQNKNRRTGFSLKKGSTVLSKRAEREISRFQRVNRQQDSRWNWVIVFSLSPAS